jgi:HlyD family secretion protein
MTGAVLRIEGRPRGPRGRRRAGRLAAVVVLLAAAAACTRAEDGPVRASGYVEATEVRVAPEVGGRIVELAVEEGDRIAVGAVIARLDTSDTDLAIRRADAERAQAVAQLKLLQAGARAEDIRQARAQAESAQADVAAAQSELKSAVADLGRFEALLASNSGSRKQRDDAATRRDVSESRVKAAQERATAAAEGLARVRAGARREELAAAQARIDAIDASIASMRKNQADAVLKAPVGGVVTARLVDAGELIAPRTAVVVLTDLDRAWANVYVDEPFVPKLSLGQTIPLVTDAQQRIEGRITFISPKAEFTPRNVQTAEERSKLVYRIKVTTDNRQGLLKSGMPVEAEIPR